MPAKPEYPYPQVEVSVVIIKDDEGRILLDFNDSWGAFTLPMSKRNALPPAVEHGTATTETPLAAAVRAAAEVIGRPLDPATLTPLNLEIPPYNQSGRDGQWKRYTYRVFTLKAPGEPKPVPGHSAVWATRAELGTLAPLSPTVALVLQALPN